MRAKHEYMCVEVAMIRRIHGIFMVRERHIDLDVQRTNLRMRDES